MNSDKSERERRIDEIATAYLKELEAGRAPNQSQWLARHPDLAGELAEFFAAQEQVHQLAAPLRAAAPVHVAEAPTTGLNSAAGGGSTLGARIQYFGDYELLEEIGRGGMGVVYKARQVSLKRVVALKMILTGQLADAADVRRFHAEAQAAAKLDHAGIVPVFEVGEHEGHQYFTMAYVEGKSLALKMLEGLPPPREAATLMKQVAEAVAYAHLEGVVHRDLKPANILIDKTGQPRLTDFGLAKRVRATQSQAPPGTASPEALPRVATTSSRQAEPADVQSQAEPGTELADMTATGQVLGTPSYMPPEQASGKRGQVGPLSDVYSLGAVLYALLTGRPPFQAATALDMLLQVLDQDPAPLRQLSRSIPRDLETICLKCLEKEPSKRYASARALIADLDRYLTGQPIHARPASRRERVVKWVRRRPATAALLGVSAAAMIAFVVLGSIYVNNARRLVVAERARSELLRSHTYSGDVALAVVAFEKQNVSAMQDGLESLKPKPGEPDLRGFEWHYLWRQTKRERLRWPRMLLGDDPPDRVVDRRRLVYSADGKFLATTTRVCDAATGRIVLEFEDAPGRQAFFSPDSRFVFNGTHIFPLDAAGGENPAGVKVPLVAGEATRDVAGNPRHTEPSWPLGFLPDNSLVVLHPDSAPPGVKPPRAEQPRVEASLKSYDARTGKETVHEFRVRKGHRILTAALSEKRRLLAVAVTRRPVATGESVEKDEVELWDLASRERPRPEQTRAEPKVLQFERFGEAYWGLSEDLKSLLFSPEGNTLAVITRDEAIRLCDADTGKERMRTLAYSRHLTFSQDGKTLLSLGRAGDHKLRIWDATTGKELLNKEATFAGQFMTGRTPEAALSPDGKTYATGGGKRVIQLWDVATDKLKASFLGHKHPVVDLVFSPDGQTLATRDKERLSPKGEVVVRLWNTAEEKPIGLPVDTAAVTTFALTPDCSMMAAGFENGAVRLCDPKTLKVLREFKRQATAVQVLWFSPDGKQLAASHLGNTKDDNIDVWDVNDGKVIASFPGFLRGFNGKTVASINKLDRYFGSPAPPDTITLFDVATKARRLEVKDSYDKVFGMSPDGLVAATATEARHKPPIIANYRTKVWNTATGKETPSPEAFDSHGNRPSHLIFAPNGKFLAMCNTNLLVLKEGAKEAEYPSAGRLYDVATGRTILQFPLAYRYGESFSGISNWTMAQFSPDSKLLLTIGNDGDKYRSKVSLWDTATGKEVTSVPNPEKFACMHATLSPDGKSIAVVTIGSWRCERYKDGKFINDDSAISIERENVGYDGDSSGHSGGSGGLGTIHPVYEIHVWDLLESTDLANPPQRRRRFLVSWQMPIEQMAFSRDGQLIYILLNRRPNESGGPSRRLQAWDIATGKEVASVGDHGTRFHALAYADDGLLLALTDQILNQRRPRNHPNDYRIRTWDVTNQKELGTGSVAIAPDLPVDLDPQSLAIAPNTKDEQDDAEDFYRHGSHSTTAVSPDGKVKAVRAYHWPIHSPGPDGRTKIDPSPTDVTLVDVATGRVMHTLKGYGQWVCRLAFTPDGKTLAVGDHNGKIHLWNVAAGRLLLTIPAHDGPVCGLAFRGDGKVLASCNDSEIRLWRAAGE